MTPYRLLLAFLALPIAFASTAAGQDANVEAPVAEAKPAPYDPQLARLSEILGAVHYLRNLCGGAEPEWRQSMESMLELETADEPERRRRLTAAFNRGYRSFAAVHVQCTPAAIASEEQYRNEGATLAAEIAARYGN